jgi:hypothetical protein
LKLHVFSLFICVYSYHRYALAQATAEQGKFLVAGEEVEKTERLNEKHKLEMSASRVRRENTNAALADRRRRTREK